MKYYLILALLMAIGCKGKLTDQQRQEAKEVIASNKIKRISQAEIMAASFSYGKTIAKQINKANPTMDSALLIDSIQRAHSVKIRWLEPGMSGLTAVEKKIIEAYNTVRERTHLVDNVQRVDGDSMLYTVPTAGRTVSDSVRVSQVLEICMPIKRIILFMDKSKK